MKRKEFIKKAAASFVALNTFSVFDLMANSGSIGNVYDNLAVLDENIKKDFNDLVNWLKESGWEAYLKEILKRDIVFSDEKKLCEVITDVQEVIKINRGFDDFGGNKLIEPGSPSLSLLYHALASPRVKSSVVTKYPEIKHLDILENYIYALKKWEDYLNEVKDKSNLQLMVLAYEYRPAYKTPALGLNDFEQGFAKYAQIVFSRSGIARVGNRKMNYDAESRGFTNKPMEPEFEKEIAVTPARYGLFLVELVPINKKADDLIKVMNFQDEEYTTYKWSVKPLYRHFIKPIRKIFDDSTFNIRFGEHHLNQKLYKFSQFELKGETIAEMNSALKWDLESPPFKRSNSTDDSGAKLATHKNDAFFVALNRTGSSVLLSSVPSDLTKIAKQNSQNLFFKVPGKWERRYNALKLNNKKNKDRNDSIITQFFLRYGRKTSIFRALRNAPLFINIKFKKTDASITHLDEYTAGMEDTIKNGDYHALLFEDNMCDGCVSAKLTFKNDLRPLTKDIFDFGSRINPAFSLVAAPDFFPFLDSNDIAKYYKRKKIEFNDLNQIKTIGTEQEQQLKQIQLSFLDSPNDEHFLEGGTLNLSGIRQRGNPEICDPFSLGQAFSDNWKDDKSFDTLTAVVATNYNIKSNKSDTFCDNYKRDYNAYSFLPDTGTGIFYPGWDATYSGEELNPYFATFGLGSPFPEDMKLCAAANGMWPVASPDAGRTFQGSLEKFPILGRPNTSIPLMDNEIGLHQNSPHVKQYKENYSYGWDGEQGPYLFIDEKDKNALKVNFTDIGRADYVKNILPNGIGFDMSKLRKMNSKELIDRMDCLRLAIRKIDNTRVEYTNYWLISAEKVENWNLGANAFGIPQELIGNSNNWAKISQNLQGPGYLFVFAITKIGKRKEEFEENSKRRNQKVKKLAICKVSSNISLHIPKLSSNIEWCEFSKIPSSAAEIKWKDS